MAMRAAISVLSWLRGQTINQDDDNKNNISGDDISVSVEKG